MLQSAFVRRQDQILNLYPRTPANGQLLLLGQLEDIAPQFDHPRLIAFLARESDSADPWLAYLAQSAKLGLEPLALARGLGLRQEPAGLRSTFHADLPAGAASVALEAPAPALRQVLYRGAVTALGALVEPLCAIARAPGPLAASAMRCLSGVPTPEALSCLRALAEGGPARPLALLYLARSDSRRARLTASEQLATGDGDPLALAALRFVAPERRLELLKAAAADPASARAAAVAAAGLPAAEGLELVTQLLTSADAVVRALALRALALQGNPAHLAAVAYGRETDVLLRTFAVDALARSAAPETVHVLLNALPTAPPAVQGRILEVLLHATEPALRRRALECAGTLVRSNFLAARVPAIVLLSREDPRLVLEPLGELLGGEDAGLRMNGAYCLGFLPQASAARTLAELARSDPAREVRLAAVASLSRFPGDLSLAPLLAALATPDPEVAEAARWALEELEVDPAALLERARASAAGAAHLALLAGRMAARSGDAALLVPVAALLASPDPALARAAIRAHVVAGVPATAALTARLAAPDTRAAAQLWRWLSGDLQVVGELAADLAAPGPAATLAAVSDAVALLRLVGVSRRFSALEQALVDRASESGPGRHTGQSGFMSIEQVRPEPETPLPSAAPPVEVEFVRRTVPSGRIRTGVTGMSSKLPVPPSQARAALAAARRGGVLVLALATILGVLHLALRPTARVAPQAAATPAAPRVIPGLSVTRANSGDGEVHPPVGQLLRPRIPFRTSTVLALTTPFPPGLVLAHPGAGQLDTLTALPNPSSGYAVELTLEPGEYHVDTRPGATRAILHFPWGTVTATMALADVLVEPDHTVLRLHAGRAVIAAATSRTLDAPAVWEGP